MKTSDRQPKISDSLKISDFSDSLGVLQHPLAPPAIRLCPGGGASNDNGVIDNGNFSDFAGYLFRNFRDKANVII